MYIITAEELEVVTSALFTRHGLDFKNYEPISFRRRVSWAMSRLGLASVYELWKKILYEQGFLTTFINEITVNLTDLFRNPPLWRYIEDALILPQYTQKERLQIWSAGCSTGEEVYSLLILLKEAKAWHNTQILATDINTDSLQTAKQGFYTQDVWNNYQKNYAEFTRTSQSLQAYTEPQEGGFRFHPDLLRYTTFAKHNLMRDNMNQQFDFIFCRNVMIYFDEVLKAKVLQLLHHALKPQGYFIIGYYDILPTHQNLFEVHQHEYKIYRKID